jgi:hypothetical protein
MKFSKPMLITLMTFVLVAPPISGADAIDSSITAETDQFRVSNRADISELDAHSRLANWTFDNLTEYGYENLSRTEDGVGLLFDPERYAGGVISNISDINDFGGFMPYYQSDMAVNSKGDYVVVWITTPSSYLIGQGYYANGTPKGNKIEICKGQQSQESPRIIFDSSDNLLAVWRDHRDPTVRSEIYGQRFDTDNNALGTECRISSVPNEGKIAIGINSRGEYILAWNMGIGIHIQMLDKSGSPYDEGIGLLRNASGVGDPVIDCFSNDDFVIAWSEENVSQQKTDTYFQRFKSDCTIQGDMVTVGSPAESRANPGMAIDSNDNMTLIWRQDSYHYPILSQKYDRAGANLTGIDLICNDTGILWHTDVAAASDDKIVIAWSGKQSVDASSGTAVAQLFNENGTPNGGRISVYEGEGYVRGPVIAPQPDNAFMVGWSHEFCDYGEPIVVRTYVYTRRFLQGAYAENGTLVTSDIEPKHLCSWGNLSANAGFGNPAGNRLDYYYSINGGLNWTPAPRYRDLSKVNISTCRIRFKVEFSTTDSRTTPLLRSLELAFVENLAPVLVSLAPAEVLNAYRREPVNFVATATDADNDVLLYDWYQTAGPGSFLEENGTANPYFIPYELGFYQFRLVVGDGFTKTAPIVANITVVNRPPAIRLWSDGRPYKNMPLQIHAAIIDLDEDEFTYNWSLAESPPGAMLNDVAGMEPVLTCPVVGDCVVVLRAVDIIGDESNVTARYSFVGHDPISVMSANRTTGRPYAAFGFFGANSSDPDNDPILFRFDFGDGNLTEWNASATASHGYTMPGDYTVRLECRDSDGNASSATVNITVLPFNRPPIASFTAVDGNLTRAFQFNSTSFDPDGTVASYLWDFGDGTSGSGRIVSHLYLSGGDFLVVLIVTDNEGAEANGSYFVRINRPPIISAFFPQGDQTLKLGQTAGFTINATDPDGNLLNCSWFVNGVQANNGKGFSFIFSSKESGGYVVVAKIEDGQGGSISHGWNITVELAPKENINIGDATGYIILIVVLVMAAVFIVIRSRRFKNTSE